MISLLVVCWVLGGLLSGLAVFFWALEDWSWPSRACVAAGFATWLLGPVTAPVVLGVLVVRLVRYLGAGLADVWRLIPRRPKAAKVPRATAREVRR